jgi:hypothetical protein
MAMWAIPAVAVVAALCSVTWDLCFRQPPMSPEGAGRGESGRW